MDWHASELHDFRWLFLTVNGFIWHFDRTYQTFTLAFFKFFFKFFKFLCPYFTLWYLIYLN